MKRIVKLENDLKMMLLTALLQMQNRDNVVTTISIDRIVIEKTDDDDYLFTVRIFDYNNVDNDNFVIIDVEGMQVVELEQLCTKIYNDVKNRDDLDRELCSVIRWFIKRYLQNYHRGSQC